MEAEDKLRRRLKSQIIDGRLVNGKAWGEQREDWKTPPIEDEEDLRFW